MGITLDRGKPVVYEAISASVVLESGEKEAAKRTKGEAKLAHFTLVPWDILSASPKPAIAHVDDGSINYASFSSPGEN